MRELEIALEQARRHVDTLANLAHHPLVGSNIEALPGSSWIEDGLADLSNGIESVAALLVAIGAPRLRDLGVPVPPGPPDPEHRLYTLLAVEHGHAAHGKYNALVRRLASFERALACGR